MKSQGTRTKTKRYLFTTDFDELSENERAQAPRQPAAPSFSAEDLAQAETAAFAAGRDAARAEARASQEQTIADALGRLEVLLGQAEASLAEHHQARLRNAVEVAMAALRKLFPDLARRHGLEEAMALLASCLERLDDEPRLVIRIADAALDAVKMRVDSLTQRCGYEGRVILLADDSLAEGDLRIEWADGGAERDSGRLWQEIEEILAGAGVTGRTEAAAAEPATAESTASSSRPLVGRVRTESRISEPHGAPTQEHNNE